MDELQGNYSYVVPASKAEQ